MTAHATIEERQKCLEALMKAAGEKNALTQKSEWARSMAQSSRRRRILRTVLGDLMLFCVTASGAPAHDRKGASTSVQSGLVKLPIVEKQDLRFLPFSLNGEALGAGS